MRLIALCRRNRYTWYMPKRPRSHQLETLSEERFRALLPKHWVVRRKDLDYGIDLEVELFDDKDEATGFIFYVQLRATDDIKKRQKMSVDKDQQEYFSKLDVPTILVRYYAADDCTHWKWHSSLPEINDNRRSQTIRFSESDRWSDDTVSEIEEALRLWKSVKLQTVSSPVSVYLDIGLLPPLFRQPFRTSFRRLIDDTAALSWDEANTENALLTVTAEAEKLTVSLGKVGTLSGPCNYSNLDATQSQLRYMMVAVLHKLGLRHHADRVARRCLAAQAPSPMAELAHIACDSLTSSAMDAVKLAVLNRFHDHRQIHSVLFTSRLHSQPFDIVEKSEAIRFFIEKIQKSAHEAGDANAEGAAFYSLGNHYAMARKPAAAISALNKARKLRPSYMATGYFLSEIGGVLFGSGHFMASADFYARSEKIETSQLLSLHLGDALLMSAQFAMAESSYEAAQGGDNSKISAEAAPKLLIAEWLKARHGPIAKRRTSVAMAIARSEDDPAIDWRILNEIDAMDNFAHWNIGVALAKADNHNEALGHFLVCAFQKSGDSEAWTNALLCAFNISNMLMFQLILRCALVLGGPSIADDFCARLAPSDEAVTLITSIIVEFSKEFEVGRELSSTLRILTDEQAPESMITSVP